jgi:hypothetical protein
MAIGNLDNLPGTTRIAFLTPNLKKAGSASHNKYEANIGATTLTQLRARPGASDDKDINWGAARHFITVQGLLPPPLIVDRHAKCHLCNSVYTTGARRPDPNQLGLGVTGLAIIAKDDTTQLASTASNERRARFVIDP